MEKINIVMIVLNGEYLEQATQNLNFDKVNLTAIITDSDEKTFKVVGEEIPINSFSNASKLVKDYKEFIWLIVGYEKCLSEVLKMKKFLMTLGLPEDNIVNFELSEQINSAWLANLRYVEENGADYTRLWNNYDSFIQALLKIWSTGDTENAEDALFDDSRYEDVSDLLALYRDALAGK